MLASPERCDRVREDGAFATTASSDPHVYWICDFDALSTLRATKGVSWSLTGSDAVLAMRVGIGKGSVTVLNARPFRERSIFNGDHGWLLVAATQLRRGDEMHFLSEEDHPSLVGLIWLYGKPLVLLGMVLISLLLWRDSVRIGPLAVPPTRARRSLAEQIRGIGQFAIRHGGGEALMQPAQERWRRRRRDGYPVTCTSWDRAAKIAELTGFDRDGVNAAIHHPGLRQSSELATRLKC